MIGGDVAESDSVTVFATTNERRKDGDACAEVSSGVNDTDASRGYSLRQAEQRSSGKLGRCIKFADSTISLIRSLIAVAIQCLETGYDVKDADYAFQPSKPLLDIFKQAENVGDTPEVRMSSFFFLLYSFAYSQARLLMRRRVHVPRRSRTRAMI